MSDSVTDDSPEGHVDDPDDEGDERRKGSAEGHEDCANSAESSAAETKDDCNKSKCSSNGMEDEHVRQVVQSLCAEGIVPVGSCEPRCKIYKNRIMIKITYGNEPTASWMLYPTTAFAMPV